MKRAVVLGVLAIALVSLPIGFFAWLRVDYDRIMFLPKPRDWETMAHVLAERFGDRVTILELPMVNRDVNGYAARVRTSIPHGVYVTEGHAFSFERIDGRDVCLMTMLPWELQPLRATYRAKILARE